MKRTYVLIMMAILVSLLPACAQPTPQVIKETVVVEKEVVKEVVKEVEKEVTKVVEKEVIKEVEKEITRVVTPEPPPSAFAEPPMLAEMVNAGTLPPVEERVPVNPYVQKVVDETGTYGGNIKWGFVGDWPWGGGMWWLQAENIIAWKSDYSGVEPNFIEYWETSPDATEYTFYLRRGMKWSDGAPFTADDMLFYVEDVIFNEELVVGGPRADWLPQEGAEDFKIAKLDDYTVRITFAYPNGLFPLKVATWSGREWGMYPKHYCQQFHAKYNPEVDALVEQADAENIVDWVALFNNRCGWGAWYTWPELPTTYAWVLTQPLGTGTEIVFERNPYFWKVDDEGNQLPYIDTLTGVQFQDTESQLFAIINGDVDATANVGSGNRTVYYDALDAGKPIVIKSRISDGSGMGSINFNQTTADPILAEVFASKDFRIGMSHAIDRDEVNEVIAQGQGTWAQPSPPEDSPLYHEQLATQYTEYDVDLANEYLDKVLPDKDAEGFRLNKNGERFSFILTVQEESWALYWPDLAELLIKYWEAVGVEAKMSQITGEIQDVMWGENQMEAFLWATEGGRGLGALLEVRCYVPTTYQTFYAYGWAIWRANPESEFGVEPPQWALDAYAKYEHAAAQPSEAAQIEAMMDVLDEAADRFYLIGTVRPAPGYWPHNERLANVPDGTMGGWPSRSHQISRPQQWYIKE
jgi:peptide/nickel transport system substrate-binding protein